MKNDDVIDNILKELGIGRFQIITLALMCLPAIFIPCASVMYVFTTRDTEYRCLVPECEETPGIWLQNALPLEDGIPKKCEKFTVRDVNETCSVDSFDNTTTERCTEWVHDEGESIVMDLQIPCEDWKRSLVASVSSTGQLVSLLCSGFLSDRFGRRNLMVIMVVSGGLIGIIQSFSTNYWMFLILEFLNLSFGSGAYGTAYIMTVESFHPEKRIYGCTIVEMVCVIARASVGLIAWATPTWRWLLRSTNIPAFSIIIAFWFLPESVRWLYAKGRGRECAYIFKKAAKMNRVNLSERCPIELNNLINDNSYKKATDEICQKSITKSPRLILRLITCAFCWFACCLSFTGLVINSVNISEATINIYVDFFIISIIELPSLFFYSLALKFASRRLSLIIPFFGHGLFSIAYAFVINQNASLELFFYLMSKFFISISFMLMFIYTAEMFPTGLRNSSMNICSIIGRFGGMLAPQILLLQKVHKTVPMIFFGAVSLLSTLAIFKLPETRNKKMPDTLSEAENL